MSDDLEHIVGRIKSERAAFRRRITIAQARGPISTEAAQREALDYDRRVYHRYRTEPEILERIFAPIQLAMLKKWSGQ